MLIGKPVERVNTTLSEIVDFVASEALGKLPPQTQVPAIYAIKNPTAEQIRCWAVEQAILAGAKAEDVPEYANVILDYVFPANEEANNAA